MSLFNRITIRTPESVELEFTLAGIGNRTLALFTDYLIWSALLFLVLIIRLIVMAWMAQNISGDDALGRGVDQWITAITWLVVFAIYTGYFVFFETLWQGQTPGKRRAKIRVIRDNGQTAGLSQALLRSLLRPVDDLFCVGLFCILLGKQEKRLGDWAAGTLVVSEAAAIAQANFPVSPQAQSLADQLITQQNISALLPDDFAVIREYLQRRTVMEPRAKSELSLQLARQARTLIGMHDLPFEMTADQFLEAVYLAYQQQSN
jgi:uncharacterized RDD family membrane protein YckC